MERKRNEACSGGAYHIGDHLQMAVLDILTYPHPFLRTKARAVTSVDAEIRSLIDDMAETMYQAPGTGLAATQVGADKRIIVYDVSSQEEAPNLQALVNPVIVAQTGDAVSENEGCLSVPEYRSDVKRAAAVRVEALDREGNPVAIEDESFLAIVLQHEIDHLDGILFIDRISPLKREMYKRRIKKQQRSK
jgi:peptide deformylase